MKLVELTQQDYRAIKDMALNMWRDRAISYKNAEEFVCQCYVAAVAAFCTSRGLTLQDGKFYEKKIESK
jgi:hypothetical protein